MKLSVFKKSLRLSLFAILLLTLFTACSRDGKRVESPDDLKGATVGVQLGTTADESVTELEKKGFGTKVERFTKTADAIQALLQGKLDCIVDNEQPVKAFTRENPGLRELDEPYGGDSFALSIAKGNVQLKHLIDSALVVLSENGTLERILHMHIEDNETVAYQPKESHGRVPPLIVATNATFPPYEYYEKGEIVGIDVDLMRAIGDVIGRDVIFQDMAFDAVLTSVQSGKADVGAAGMTVTPERQKNVLFSTPYAFARLSILVQSDELLESKSLIDRLRDDFFVDGRYFYLLKGLGNTLIITFFAAILSLILGSGVAVVRASHDRTGKLPLLNFICKVYLAVLRGTPTMVQLLIIYYIIFASVNVSKAFVAIVAFGINSSAYLAEVVRAGIMAIDKGQMEAGRSLGLNHLQTMRLVILPQAFKNVLPAMGNEVITLLKETSIAGYIGLVDLTKGSDIIRSITYDAMLPLITVAVIYFAMVATLSLAVNKLEKRLRNNERK